LLLNLVRIGVLIVSVLIGVAFLTLLERKILGYVQLRKGPNKVGFLGIIQPFRDAIKLFNKELFIISKSNYYIFYICPIILFFLIILNWSLRYFITNIYFINYSLLIIVIILTLIGYLFLLIGWSSNSIYSIIGSVRVIAQTLSYEVSFIIIILILIILRERYSFGEFIKWQLYVWYIIILFPLFIVFFIRVLAELNRRPIDFIEGESELVSGFNIEYFRGGFALIFIAEYGIIIFFRYLILIIFINVYIILIYIFINVIISLIILIRGLLPRMRYDELIYLCWKIILPFILNYIIIVLGFKYILVIVLYVKINRKFFFFFIMFSKHILIQDH